MRQERESARKGRRRRVDARQNYLRMTLGISEETLDRNPIEQLARWIGDASETAAGEPTAMSLGTATPDGRPSVRYVLLRGLDDRGLRFYTSYFSRKGRQLEANPFAAAALFWPD